MEAVQRAKARTPRFFRKLRNLSLTLAAVSGAILAAPIALPAIVITGAGYIALAGSVAGAVSQLAKETE